MKVTILLITLGFFTLLFAGTETICHPPQNVQAQTVYNGALISWDYSLPDSVLSYNNSYPSGIWSPVEKQALGVAFDLSAYPGATLEQIDFAHFSRGLLTGASLYNIHIYDMTSGVKITEIDSLTAGDAAETPHFEVGVSLGSVPAPERVGIFIEGLTIVPSGDKNYSFPALMSDNADFIYNVNYYLYDFNTAAIVEDEHYTQSNAVGGPSTTNFILDLWINLGNGKQLVSAAAEPDTFRVFRGATEEDLMQIGEIVDGGHSFTDTQAPGDSSYIYAVSASCSEGTSGLTSVAYTHPMIYSVAEARVDADHNYIPDLLNEKIYVKGVVNSPDFDARTDYFIQGGMGGMRLSNPNFTKELNIGDSVFVQGFVQQMNGMTQIVPESGEQILVFSEGNAVDTLALTMNDVSENYEGMLVSIEDVSLLNPELWPAEGVYSTQVQAVDATDTLHLILDQDTDLDGITPPDGSFRLVGIVDQVTYTVPADGNYYLRPRFMSDLGGLTSLENHPGTTPSIFTLSQNYPNPFNPTTTINYELSATNDVKLVVYNALGQKVQTLVNGMQTAGKHQASFDASGLASGIYYYKLISGSSLLVRKMVLIR